MENNPPQLEKLSKEELDDVLTQGAVWAVKKGYGEKEDYMHTEENGCMKDANPVFFTILRDGIPLYDRGVFMPWKLMLEMGRIKPSPEAIDVFMSTGERILESVQYRLRDILEKDIYWAVLNPSQAALMMYGIAPPTPKETANLLEEIFVKRHFNIY